MGGFTRDVRAVSPIIATILLVAITVVVSAAAYVMFIGFSSGGGNPVGVFVEVRQDPADQNTYVAVLGPTTEPVHFSECKGWVNGQLTNEALDQYVGRANAWTGTGVELFLVDLAANGRVDNGDMIYITVTNLDGQGNIDLGLVYLPAGSMLASVLFSVAGQIDPGLDLFLDFPLSDPFSDLAGKQADATVAPATWTAPRVVSVDGVDALDLDPNGRTFKRYVRVANGPDLNPVNGVYVEARVKIVQSPNTMESGAALLSKGTDSYRLALSGGSGANMNRYFQFTVRIDGVGARSVNSVTTVQAGEWYTVAGSYDAVTGQLSIFVNGVKERTVVVSGQHTLTTSTSALNIGYSSGNRYFAGYVDWVKVSGN